MKLSIDFETRSRVPLKDHGLYAYAEDASTDVFCCAVKVDDQKTGIWIAPQFMRILKDVYHDLPVINDETFRTLIAQAKEIHAFNAQFERVIYKEILEKRMGFPALPFEVWRCTAAKAAYYALPRSLADCCTALDLPVNKDGIGTKIMLRMSVPLKNKGARTGTWNEDPQDFIGLLKYCIQDTDAEYGLADYLPDVPEIETRMYHLDQKINDRGVYVDREAIQNLIWKVEEKQRQLLLKVQELTSGRIKSTRQTEATKQWLREQGVDLENLQKETVKAALNNDMPFAASELLGARQSLAKASVSKLDAMMRWACRDGRVRGSLQYYGAGTGRWAGRGIQPQNFQRDSFKEDEIAKILNMSVAEVDENYKCTMIAASKCLRGMICVPPNKKILCVDFASIEARVLAWMAGEEKKIKAFEAGSDVYVLNAVDIYKIRAELITKDQRLIGKVCELALGYQGWLGAFQSMAKIYGVTINIDSEIAAYKRTKKFIESRRDILTEQEITEIREGKESDIILKWRAANQKIVLFWAGVNEAAMMAVRTGETYSYGRIKFGMRGRFLHCRLPSGRLLSYCDPRIETITTKYKQQKEVISFMGFDNTTNQWRKEFTYGGKITENIVQAAARDLLRDALFRCEAQGYNTVLHVHDEILSEENPTADLEKFTHLIAQVPEWAKGCPIAAEGWEGKRYRK